MTEQGREDDDEITGARKDPFRGVLREGWRIVWHRLGVMTAYTLLVWGASAIVVVPVVIRLLRFLATYDDVIVGNYSLHLWLLSPRGFGYFLLTGTLLLFVVILTLGGLMEIALSDRHRDLSASDVMFRLVADFRALLILSTSLFLRSLPFVAALAVGPLLSYLLLLTHHDINYYLIRRPLAWWAALVVSGVWIVVVLAVMMIPLVRWIFALPAWLTGTRPFNRALRLSWDTTEGLFWRLLRPMAACVSVPVLGGMLLDLFSFLLAGWLLLRGQTTVDRMVHIIATHVLAKVVLSIVFTFLGVIWGASVWAVCYHRRLGPVVAAPELQPDAPGIPVLAGRLQAAVVVVLLLSAGSWVLSAWMMNREIPTSTPLIIAHRAGAANAPENSLSGLRRVLSDGIADMAEIDVTITSNGVLVAAHDTDMMKQAADPRVIRESSYEDLREIDVGSSFDPAYAGERIARLDQILSIARNRLPLLLEFKHGEDSELVEQVVAMVRRFGMENQVMIISLQLEELREVQRLAPEIKVAYLASMEIGNLRRLDVDALGLKKAYAHANLIRDFKEQQGGMVFAWTIDDPVLMIKLIEAGVDGLITNDPANAHDVVRHFESLAPKNRVLLRFRRFWPMISRTRVRNAISEGG